MFGHLFCWVTFTILRYLGVSLQKLVEGSWWETRGRCGPGLRPVHLLFPLQVPQMPHFLLTSRHPRPHKLCLCPTTVNTCPCCPPRVWNRGAVSIAQWSARRRWPHAQESDVGYLDRKLQGAEGGHRVQMGTSPCPDGLLTHWYQRSSGITDVKAEKIFYFPFWGRNDTLLPECS